MMQLSSVSAFSRSDHMPRILVRILFLVAFVTVTGAAAVADKRVALVIGNSAYKHAPELDNPKNDAADMAVALKALGVTVISGVNLDKAGLDRTIKEFSVALSGADVGVFFYAGHGIQVNGVNYLVPIDAELSTAVALEFEMVRLDLVQRIMEGEAKTNLLFLDACRNNPLSRNLARAMGTRSAAIGKGLAPAESGVGTLISFSTQPGNVALDGAGRNSPYTGPLVKALATPGEDVISILTTVRNEVLAATADKQIPWENHALRSRFFFKPPAPAQPPQQASVQSAPPQSNPPASSPADAERAWGAAKDSNDALVFESFLRRFGDSFYADLAKSKLSEVNRKSADATPNGQDRAIADANRVIELSPRSAVAYRSRALAYADKKDPSRAISDYTTAIELDPKYASAIFGRGNAYLDYRDSDRALTDFNTAIDLDPKLAGPFINRGNIFHDRKDYARAVADYTKAIDLNPTATTYANRGNSLRMKKDYDLALVDYDKAIAIDTKYTQAYRSRGLVKMDKKDVDAAILDFDKAIELDPKVTNSFLNRGFAYEQKQNIEKAAADYAKAYALEPKNSYVLEAYKRIGRTPPASP
jgi:uncharacterized caspase-like protein/Tfp pilus assembly protein PilF